MALNALFKGKIGGSRVAVKFLFGLFQNTPILFFISIGLILFSFGVFQDTPEVFLNKVGLFINNAGLFQNNAGLLIIPNSIMFTIVRCFEMRLNLRTGAQSFACRHTIICIIVSPRAQNDTICFH